MGKRGRPRIVFQFSKRLLAKYQAGAVNHQGLAEWFGVSVPTVVRELERLGVLRKVWGRPRIVIHITKRILAKYASGEMTGQQVAKFYGVSVDKAVRELRCAGADTSRSTRKKIHFARKLGVANLQEKTVALYQKGLSLNQIAEKFGLTHEGVRQILIRNGKNRRPPGSRVFVGGNNHKPFSVKRFAVRLRSLRREAALSHEQLASRCGLRETTVRHLEDGGAQPRWETILKLAKALRVSADMLEAARPKQS